MSNGPHAKLAELGLSLPEVALPHMESLVAQVNESCSISVLDDTDVGYVARVPTRRSGPAAHP